MLHRKWTTIERCLVSALADEIAATVDAELGRMILAAIEDDSLWPAIHDRLNLLGRYEQADQVRRIMGYRRRRMR